MQPVRATLGLRGRFRWSILNEDGTPGFATDQHGRQLSGGQWHDNLITKLGMNNVAGTGAHPTDFGSPGRSYLHVGEGALTVETDSGAVTAAQAGTTVTASAAVFAAGNVGDLIVWDSGETALITTVTDTTHVEVTKTATVASGLFTIKHAGTFQLVSQVQSGNGNGGFGDSNNFYLDDPNEQAVGEYTTTRVITMTANRNLTEFGFSPDGVATNLHIIELFRDSGGAPITLTIPSGKKIRVDHTLVKAAPWAQVAHEFDLQEFDVTDTPLSVTAATNASPIQITTNFPHGLATGDQVNITGVTGNAAANGINTVTVLDATNFTLDGTTGSGAYASGGTVARHMQGDYFPVVRNATVTATQLSMYFDRFLVLGDNYSSIYGYFSFSTSDIAIPAYPFASASDFFQSLSTTIQPTITADTYVSDSMQQAKKCLLAESQANGAIRDYGFVNMNGNVGQIFKFSSPASFAKDSTHTLTVGFLISWWWSF